MVAHTVPARPCTRVNRCDGLAAGEQQVRRYGSVIRNEGRRLARMVEQILRFAALQSGQRDPDEFKRFRLENGVYGIRGTTDRHMVRIKIRHGALTSEQLETIADIAEQFTPLQIGPLISSSKPIMSTFFT